MSREEKRARARDERRADRAAAVSATPADNAPLTRDRTSPRQFLREVRSELRKVAWPSRREVAVYTVTVLALTTVLTLVVWGMDFVLRQAATQFL